MGFFLNNKRYNVWGHPERSRKSVVHCTHDKPLHYVVSTSLNMTLSEALLNNVLSSLNMTRSEALLNNVSTSLNMTRSEALLNNVLSCS